MINIQVRAFKIKLSGEEYTFRLDFKALLKFNSRYKYTEDDEGVEKTKDAMDIFNSFLRGVDTYESIVKILSCSCIEKEFTEDELSNLLSFDYQTMKLMDEITFALIEGMVDKNEGTEVKKEETNQEKLAEI